MAFIVIGGNVTSYAEALDIQDKDQRLFEANEINFTDVPDAPGSLNNYLEDLATKATDRINQKIRASARWNQYLGWVGDSTNSGNDIPAFNPDLILTRKSDFTDMCCYYTLKEYILPKIADFGNPESGEVQKITYYENKFNDLFEELTNMWDYYDKDNSGTVDGSEKMISVQPVRRSRRRTTITRVR